MREKWQGPKFKPLVCQQRLLGSLGPVPLPQSHLPCRVIVRIEGGRGRPQDGWDFLKNKSYRECLHKHQKIKQEDRKFGQVAAVILWDYFIRM